MVAVEVPRRSPQEVWKNEAAPTNKSRTSQRHRLPHEGGKTVPDSALDHCCKLLREIPKNANRSEPRPGFEKSQGRRDHRRPRQGPRLRRAQRKTDHRRVQILSTSTRQGRESRRTLHTLLQASRGKPARNKRKTATIVKKIVPKTLRILTSVGPGSTDLDLRI